MKKKYLIPEMEVVKLNACQPMMTTSSMETNDEEATTEEIL